MNKREFLELAALTVFGMVVPKWVLPQPKTVSTQSGLVRTITLSLEKYPVTKDKPFDLEAWKKKWKDAGMERDLEKYRNQPVSLFKNSPLLYHPELQRADILFAPAWLVFALVPIVTYEKYDDVMTMFEK